MNNEATFHMRAEPREKNIKFECVKKNGEKKTIYAVDASEIAARFNAPDGKEVLNARKCHFAMNDRKMVIESKDEWLTTGKDRDKENIIGYKCRPAYPTSIFRKLLYLPAYLFSRREELFKEKNRYSRRKFTLLFEKVSRIHLYEAQEKYVFLESTIDVLKKLMNMEKEDSPLFNNDDPENRMSKESKVNILLLCEEKLNKVEVLLTRHQNDLNFLWRELTQIHIYLLKWVIPPQFLPEHYDFCCEEAKKLSVVKDPEVAQLIKNIAEDKDSEKKNRLEMRRHLRALTERLSTIRTGRIHQQFINVSCLRNVMLLLIPLAVIMFYLAPEILQLKPTVNGNVPVYSSFIPSFNNPIGHLVRAPLYLFTIMLTIIQSNVLVFVAFVGLLGGFFSAATRLHAKEFEPGSDAYFGMYVFAKPIIGAMGAVILFLLVQAEVIHLEIIKDLILSSAKNVPNPSIFAFSFLAGFSERIVFPSLA